MTMSMARLNIPPPPPSTSYALQKFHQLQADLGSTARMWAVDDMGAAMAHQLNEPLTALLLYLHEIKESGEQSSVANSAPNSIMDMVEKAILETERVCEITERIGHTCEAPANAEIAVARGREAIDAWTGGSNTTGGGDVSVVPPHFSQRLLTPRERSVLALIIGGASNKEGAYQLKISIRTFEVHRAHVMAKLGAKNTADMVRMALSEIR